MTPEEIQTAKAKQATNGYVNSMRIEAWLAEIAYQLAVYNDRNQ